MAADAGTAIFRAIADFSRLRKESQKTAAELRKLKDEAEDTGAGLELIDEASDKAENSLGRFAKAAAKARRDLDGLADAAVDAGAGMELAAKAADDLADELDDVTKSAKRAERALKGLGNEAVETAAKLEAASLASESLGDRMSKSFDGASDRGSKLRAVLAELADVQRDLGRNVDTTAGDLGTLSQRFGQLDGAGDTLVRRYTEQGDGLRALSRAGQDAAAAQEVLLRSQERQEDAAGRVRVAEEKLAEARAKGKASAAQIADLEEKLAAARRKHEASARATAEAEESVAKAAAKTSAEVDKIAQASEKAADAHEKHGAAARNANKDFIQLEGGTERSGSKLLRFAAIAGGVVTALGALGGGAGAAVGGIVALAGAVGSLSGLVGLLPGVLGAAGLGVATLKVGLSGFGDVMSAVAEGDLAAFNKAIAEMGPQAQAVAQALWTWSAPLQTIKKDTQEALLNGLAPAVKELGANYLPLIHDALQRVARAFNGVAKSTLDWLNQKGQIGTVKTILDNLATALEKAAPGARNLASAFLTFFKVSSDQMPSLAEGFNQLTKRFDTFIQKAAADGSLKRWMDLGRAAAADLFASLGNLAVVLGTVFTIGQEQGRGFFDVLRTVTGEMRAFVTSGEGQSALRTFFASLHDAVVALMPAVKAAASTILQDLVPAISSIAVDVGPGLADLFDGIGDAINRARPGLDVFSEQVGNLLSALGNAGPLVGTVLGGALQGLGTIAGLAAIGVNALTTAFNALPKPLQTLIGHGVGIVTMFTAIVAGAALLAGGLSTAVVAVRIFAQGLALLARGKAGLGLSMMFGNTAKSARKAQKEIGTFGKAVGKTIDPLTREIPLDKRKGKELDNLAGSSKKAATDTKTFTREITGTTPALNNATGAAKKTTAATGELGAAGAKAGKEYPKTLSEGIKSGAAAAGTAAEGLATNAGAKGKAAAGKAGTEAGREYPKTLQQGLSPNSGGIANAMTEPINTGGRQATTAAGTHGGAAGRGFLSKLTGALRGGAGAITGAIGSLLGGLGGAAGRAGTAGQTAGGNFVTRMGTRLRGGAAETTAAGTAATAGLGGAAAASAGAAGAKAGTGWVSRLGGVLRGAGGVLGIAAGIGIAVMGADTQQKAAEQGRLSGEGYIRDAKGAVDVGGQALASAGSNAWLLMFGQIGAVIATGAAVYDQDRAAMEYYNQNKIGILKGATAAFGEEGAKQVESASQTGSGIVTAASVSGVGMEQAWKAGWDGTNRVQAEGHQKALEMYGQHVGGMEGLALQLQSKILGAVQWIGEKSRSAWDWISGLWGGGSQNAVAAAGMPLMGLGAKIAGPVQEGGQQSQGFWATVASIFGIGSSNAAAAVPGGVQGTAQAIAQPVQQGGQQAQGFWATVASIFGIGSSGAAAAVPPGAQPTADAIAKPVQDGGTKAQGFWSTVGSIFSIGATGLVTGVQTGLSPLGGVFSSIMEGARSLGASAWQGLQSLFGTGAQGSAQATATGLTGVGTAPVGPMGQAQTAVQQGFMGMVTAAQQGGLGITTALQQMGAGIGMIVTPMFAQLPLQAQQAMMGLALAVQTGAMQVQLAVQQMGLGVSTGTQQAFMGVQLAGQTGMAALVMAVTLGVQQVVLAMQQMGMGVNLGTQQAFTGAQMSATMGMSGITLAVQTGTMNVVMAVTTMGAQVTAQVAAMGAGTQGAVAAMTAGWGASVAGAAAAVIGAVTGMAAGVTGQIASMSANTQGQVTAATNGWTQATRTAADAITAVLNALMALLNGPYVGAWTQAQGAVQAASDGMGNAARGMESTVTAAVNGAIASLDRLVAAAQRAAAAVNAVPKGAGGMALGGVVGMAVGGVVGMARGGRVAKRPPRSATGMAAGGSPTPMRRSAGPVHGSGRQDKHHRLLMSDEFVVNRRDSKKHRAALELINSGRGDEVLPPGMAAGGNVAVRQGSIPEAAWDRLLSMGYRGDPNDGMEALYPSKADLATALGTGSSPTSPVSTPLAGGASPVTGAVGAAAGVVGAAGGTLTPEQLRAVQAAVAVLVAQLAAWQVRLQTLSATGMVPVVTATLGQVLPALRSLQTTLGMSATRTQTTTATVQQADTVRAQSTATANQAIVASYQQADQARTSSTQQSTSAISAASQQMASSTSSSASTIDSGANSVVAAAQRVAAATAALGGAGGGMDPDAAQRFPRQPGYKQAEDGSWVPPNYWDKRDRGGRMGAGGWYRNETGRTEYAFTEAQVLGKRRPPVDVSGMLGAVSPAELSPLAGGGYTPVSARPADFGDDGGSSRGFTVNQTNNIISPKAETGSAKLQAAGRKVARYGVTALKEAKV